MRFLSLFAVVVLSLGVAACVEMDPELAETSQTSQALSQSTLDDYNEFRACVGDLVDANDFGHCIACYEVQFCGPSGGGACHSDAQTVCGGLCVPTDENSDCGGGPGGGNGGGPGDDPGGPGPIVVSGGPPPEVCARLLKQTRVLPRGCFGIIDCREQFCEHL